MWVQHKKNIFWFKQLFLLCQKCFVVFRKKTSVLPFVFFNSFFINAQVPTKNIWQTSSKVQQNKISHSGIYLLLLFLILPFQIFSQQQDSTFLHPKRIKGLAVASAIGYGGLLVGLNTLWYREHPQSGFHFFNDSQEWMQVDKFGHSFTAFHLSKAGTKALQWAGMDKKKAGIYGSLGGWLFMLPIEVLDGFSAEYGASWSDLAANSAGSFLYAGQLLLWDEVRLKPKFSFTPSPFAKERPNMLGGNFPTTLLKDYNGQTYWLSANLHKFLPAGNRFPPWLNLALGYGTEGMVYAHPSESLAHGFDPYAQFYIGPDLGLGFIRSKKRVVKILLSLLDSIRLPAPALEINKNRIVFHPVYF